MLYSHAQGFYLVSEKIDMEEASNKVSRSAGVEAYDLQFNLIESQPFNTYGDAILWVTEKSGEIS